MLDKTIEAIKNVQSRIQDMKEDKQNNIKKANTTQKHTTIIISKIKKCMKLPVVILKNCA
jgi:pyridoxal biosynthesis lyase PdxS